MAVKYKLVTRKNLGADRESVPTKVYASMVSGDYVPFAEFVEEVADSTGVGSASVKAVIDRMEVVLVRHLRQGRRVQVGDLGHFRYYIGSSGTATEATFDASLIRKPYVRFYPGKTLRDAKLLTNYERVQPEDEPVSSEPEEDEPVVQ